MLYNKVYYTDAMIDDLGELAQANAPCGIVRYYIICLRKKDVLFDCSNVDIFVS